MASQSRSTLKANFENGDTPEGTDYSEVFDSFLALTDTESQTVVSNVTFQGQIAFSQSPVVAQKVTMASVGAVQFYIGVMVSGVQYAIPVYKN
jgi:hypothetical protein